MNNLKIMRIHFSYNQKLEEEKNLNDEIAKIKNVLKVWRMRDLTNEEKIAIFQKLWFR